MKRAQIFKIECPATVTNRIGLMSLMYDALGSIGYQKDEMDPDFEDPSYKITSILYDVIDTSKIRDFKQILLYNGFDTNGVNFTLPEQWQEAIDFAKEQLNPMLWTKIKIGDIVEITHTLDQAVKIGDLFKVSNVIEVEATSEIYLEFEEKLSYPYIASSVKLVGDEKKEEYLYRKLLLNLKAKYPIGTTVKAFNEYNPVLTIKSHLLDTGSNKHKVGFDGVTVFKNDLYAPVLDSIVINEPTVFNEDSVFILNTWYSKEDISSIIWLLRQGIIDSPFSKEFEKIYSHFLKR